MSNPCTLCPRHCGVDRSLFTGRCGVGDSVSCPRRFALLGGTLCQRRARLRDGLFFRLPAGLWLSARTTPSAQDILAKEASIERLARIFSGAAAAGRQQHQPGHCRTLCSTGHRSALDRGAISCTSRSSTTAADMKRCRPFGCWQAMSTSTLPDLKFYSPERSARYCFGSRLLCSRQRCGAGDVCPDRSVQLDSRGIIQKGTIVRHMGLVPMAWRTAWTF